MERIDFGTWETDDGGVKGEGEGDLRWKDERRRFSRL